MEPFSHCFVKSFSIRFFYIYVDKLRSFLFRLYKFLIIQEKAPPSYLHHCIRIYLLLIQWEMADREFIVTREWATTVGNCMPRQGFEPQWKGQEIIDYPSAPQTRNRIINVY